jgi:hypothetical protein
VMRRFGCSRWVWRPGLRSTAGVYIVSMRDQGSTPYWWYLAIIGAGAVPPLLTAAGLRSRFLLICDAVVLGVAAVLALPSQGMLLLPGVVAAAVMAGRILAGRRPAKPHNDAG